MRAIAVISLLVLIWGCASSRGFNREALRAEVAPQRTATEEEIKKVLATKPQLPHPFKLGVYFELPEGTRRSYRVPWAWTGEDKERVLAAFSDLKARGIVAEAFVIPASIVRGEDLKAVRLAAARTGADAVLIVSGTADLDRYNNKLGPLYFFLLTGFFVPGTVVDGLFMANASMWDVANEYLYLGAEAEGLIQKTAPAFLVDEEQIIKGAKASAVDALASEISRRLANMSARE